MFITFEIYLLQNQIIK